MMEMRFTKIKLFQVVVLITLVSPLEIDRALVERFHYTAAGGDVSVVAEMLRDGIPVGICDQTGRTALYYAAITNRKGVVNELLNNGANVNVQNNDGWAPLHQAAYHNYTDLMKVLLQYGADRSIKT